MIFRLIGVNILAFKFSNLLSFEGVMLINLTRILPPDLWCHNNVQYFQYVECGHRSMDTGIECYDSLISCNLYALCSTLFPSNVSLYLRHDFRSESEQPEGLREGLKK